MLHFIKGRITDELPGKVVIENNGIGFEVNVPEGCCAGYSLNETETTLYTAMIVKEDDISLFGFSDRECLDMFRLLLTVSGVGAKGALSMISTLPGNLLKKAIAFEDASAIAKANGIGKKTAQRVILELKDKIGDVSSFEAPAEKPEGGNEPSGDSEVKVDPNPPRESSTVTNSAAGTESHIWVQEPDGTWRYVSSDSFRAVWGYVSDPYGNGATWYDLNTDGAMQGNGLVQDNAGNYYSLDTSCTGYFGMLSYYAYDNGANIYFNNGKTTPGTDRLWCDISGNVLTGWQYINGKWYYLNPNKDGTLDGLNIGTAVTPGGYEIDASGAWTGW